MRNSVEEVEIFRDITHDIKQFNDDIQSGQLGRLIGLLNSNPYPDVRCPQGCCMFFDDYLRGKLDKTPATHHLTTICPKMTSFGADYAKLKGARPDWTIPVRDLQWIIKPSLFMTEDEGLCSIHSHQSIHATSDRQWIHVPRILFWVFERPRLCLNPSAVSLISG